MLRPHVLPSTNAAAATALPGRGVTIDSGPPNMTPGFINDSTTIIKGMVVFPRTAAGGVMNFTDLAPEDNDPYRS